MFITKIRTDVRHNFRVGNYDIFYLICLNTLGLGWTQRALYEIKNKFLTVYRDIDCISRYNIAKKKKKLLCRYSKIYRLRTLCILYKYFYVQVNWCFDDKLEVGTEKIWMNLDAIINTYRFYYNATCRYIMPLKVFFNGNAMFLAIVI